MKIAFVLTQSLESPSGLGRFGPLAREMVRLGHEVDLLALHPAWDTLQQRRYNDHGVQVNYVAPMHVRKEGARKSYYGPVRLLWVLLSATLRLAGALYRSDADVIQVCKPQPMNLLAARLARRGRPIYVDCDDYEAETNNFGGEWQRRIVRWFEDGIVGYAAGITANTHFTTQRYGAMGFPGKRLVYVPNGVERQRLVSPQKRPWPAKLSPLSDASPLVVYIGTLGILSHPVDLLLEAHRQVLSLLPDVQLALVGSGEDYDALLAMSQQLGIAGQTVFTGRVAPEEIPHYLAAATVTVDPVHDDLIARARSPLKIVESLAMGIPVVTGDVGDRREMLQNGRLGELVAPGSARALAQGILTALTDAARQQEWQQAMAGQQDSWYWDRLIDKFMMIYD